MAPQYEPKSPLPAQSQPKPGLDSKMNPQPRFMAPLYFGAGKLKGKTALITGGDSGIGRSVAVLYAREGAEIAIIYLAPEQSDADETKRAVESEGQKCLLLCGDVTQPAFCQDAVARTIQEFGKLDILVNNAAYQQEQKRFEDITEEQFDLTFKTNIYGSFT
jgi:NAD(P)-dependent dehydrogenase (short-subunit alcohol dehydrogenase family)